MGMNREDATETLPEGLRLPVAREKLLPTLGSLLLCATHLQRASRHPRTTVEDGVESELRRRAIPGLLTPVGHVEDLRESRLWFGSFPQSPAL